MTPGVVRFGGYGIAFMRGLEAAAPLAMHPVLDVLRAPEPPQYCPCCTLPASGCVRDARGDWTWSCGGGCNP